MMREVGTANYEHGRFPEAIKLFASFRLADEFVLVPHDPGV